MRPAEDDRWLSSFPSFGGQLSVVPYASTGCLHQAEIVQISSTWSKCTIHCSHSVPERRQAFGRSRPNLAAFGSSSAEVRRNRSNSDQKGPNLKHIDPNRPLWPGVDRCWSDFAQVRPELAQNRSRAGRSRPTKARARPHFARFRPVWANVGQTWPDIGQALPDSAKVELLGEAERSLVWSVD